MVDRGDSGKGTTVTDQRIGVPGASTAYRDSKVPHRQVRLVHQSLRLVVLPGERLLGMFAVTRLRRSVTVLVVTDRRLLTLGQEHVGMPLVDEVFRDRVEEVHVEKEKIFSTGVVTARTTDGEVNLGTLTYGKETFNALEEILARPVDAPFPVIVAAPPGPGRVEDVLPAGEADGTGRPTPVGPSGSDHPLVLHLTALVDLHERGALTDEEFATAKAWLLADPGDPQRG